MISVSRSDAGEVSLYLDDGASGALIDADWLPTRATILHTPYIDSEGVVWCRDRRYEPDAGGANDLICGWIGRLIEEIVGLTRTAAGDRVQVTGKGMIAQQVKSRLTHAGIPPVQAAPNVIVEMTGKPSALRKATEDIEGGGVIILAGEGEPPNEINLYRDVHRRGLRVVGAPRLDRCGATPPADGCEFPEPAVVRSGEPLPAGLWYRLMH